MKLEEKTAQEIQRLRDMGWSFERIAAKLDISKATAHKYGAKEGEEELDPVEENRKKIKATKEHQEYVAAVKELSLRDALEEQFGRIIPALDAPPKYKEPKAKGHQPTELVPLLHLSDWHFGEVVESERVLGLNEYNAEIASRRVFRVIQAFLHDLEDWRYGGRFKYDKLIIAINGDMLTGVIHDLENESELANICEATVKCGRLIALAVRDLAAKFKKVEVYCTVGNHGRLPDDKKMPMKQASRSFDWMAYAYAQEMCRDIDWVTWELPNAYAVEYLIGDHRVYQGHGNFIKQQLNTPAYGMRRFVSGMQAGRAKAGFAVDIVLFGHWHAGAKMEHAGCLTLVNPSLIGTQEMTFHNYGSISIPSQDCYIIDPERGYVGQKVFYGEGRGYNGMYDLG